MILKQVALVSQAPSVPLSEVVKVSAALQKQVSRDFAPIWNVNATVDAFARLEDVPLGYWPITMRDDVVDEFDAAGIHLDKSGQPFAVVQASSDWSLTASHEALEMLADPFGDRLVAGKAPKEAKDQKRVEYLVEVCDPSEDEAFSYTVNDIPVSDFYTPAFFDPVQSSGVRYSFTGAITRPRQVLKGGYVSWHNTVTDHWHQLTWFSGSKPVVRDLGIFAESSMSTREWIDHQTHDSPLMKKEAKAKVKAKTLFASMAAASGTPAASSGRAAMIEEAIAKLLGKAYKPQK
jgi:hypothetical protein